jgi:hypothetical protein
MDPMSDVSMCNQLLVAHLCRPITCFQLWLGTVWQVCSKPNPKFMDQMLLNHSQIDGVSSKNATSNAAEPFHVLHMDPMSDVSMCNQLLVAHLCRPIPCFGLWLGTVWKSVQQIQAQIDGVSSHDTSSNAAEPCNVPHVDPMSDVSMCNQLLVAHLCRPMSFLGLLLVVRLAGVQQKSMPRVAVFPATTPHQMLLNHFMSSIWIQ